MSSNRCFLKVDLKSEFYSIRVADSIADYFLSYLGVIFPLQGMKIQKNFP